MIRKVIIAALALGNAIASFFKRCSANYSFFSLDQPLASMMAFIGLLILCAILATALGVDLREFHD